MDSKKFFATLREVIKEEVQRAVSSEFRKHIKTMSEGITREKAVVKRPAKYSNNPLLNEILRSTEPNLADIDYYDTSPWPEMNPQRMPSFAERLDLPSTDTEGNAVNNSQVPSNVKDALTKDYSKLMRAIDEKKGKR